MGADVWCPGYPREAASFEAGSAQDRSSQPRAPLPSFLCPPPRAQLSPCPGPRHSQHSFPLVSEVHLQILRTDAQASGPPAPSQPGWVGCPASAGSPGPTLLTLFHSPEPARPPSLASSQCLPSTPPAPPPRSPPPTLRQGPTGPPIEPSFQAEGLVLSSHKPRRGGDGAAPQRHGCLCPSCAAPGPSPPPTCSEEQMSAPSPPGPATWPPSTCPQVPSSPASEPSRGNRHRGRQLLRGAWARPAGMPAALQLTMPTGRKAQGLAPGLPRAGERVPRVLAVAGGVGPAGTWRSVTFGSQASWATMPPACLLPPAAAPTQP